MADNKEELIVSVVIDNGDSQQRIDNLTRSITSLTSENKKLIDTNNALAASGRENSQEYIENARQIEINKQKIVENTASRRGLTQAIIAEDNSVKSLKVQNAELIKQRDAINTKTNEGRMRIDALNKKIDDNNKEIKKNVSGLEQQKMGIGGYTQALDKMVPGLGATVNGIRDFTAAGLRLLATPIGLILLAIAAALAAVATYFKRTEEGADSFARILKQGAAIMDVVLDRIARLGGGLVDLFTGNVEQGLQKMTHAFDDMGEEIAQEVKVAGELADSIDELEDRERSYAAQASKTTNEVKKLIIESKNRTLSEKDRIALLDKALALEQTLNKELVAIRQKQFEDALRQFEQDSITYEGKRLLNETEEEYAARILDSTMMLGENGAAKDAVKDAVIALNTAEGESLNLQEKINNQIDQNVQKMEQKKQKAEELRIKEDEIAEKAYHEYQTRIVKDQELHDKITENLAKKKKAEDEERAEKSMANTAIHLQSLTQEQELAALKVKLHNEDVERRKAFTIFIANELQYQAAVVGGILNGINQLRMMHYKNDLDALEIEKREKIKALDDRKFKEIMINGERVTVEEQYKNAVLQIEADFAAKQLEVKRKAFEDNKKNQIAQARIDQAQIILGAIKSVVGVPLVGAILAAAAAAAQLVITELQIQKIKDSVFVGAAGGDVTAHKRGVFSGRRHSSGGINYTSDDGHRINVEDGEAFFVLNRSASREIGMLSNLNQAHGGRSFYTGRAPLPRYAAGGQVIAPSVDTADFGASVREALEGVTLVVTVEDINAGQAKVARVEEAANLL